MDNDIRTRIWESWSKQKQIKALTQAEKEICSPPDNFEKYEWNVCTRYFKDNEIARVALLEGGDCEDIKLTALGKTLLAGLKENMHKEPQPEQAAPEPQQKQTKPTRRKGRPKSTFKDCMVNDEDGIRLKKIHSVMKGRIGKGAALVMLACIKKGWLIRPTYAQVKNEFGDIGSSTGYNKYLDEKRFTKDEIDGAINSLN